MQSDFGLNTGQWLLSVYSLLNFSVKLERKWGVEKEVHEEEP